MEEALDLSFDRLLMMMMMMMMMMILILIYLLTANGFTPGGSSTVQYTFTHKQDIEQHN